MKNNLLKSLFICFIYGLFTGIPSILKAQGLEIRAGGGINKFYSLSKELSNFQSAYGVRFKSGLSRQYTIGFGYRFNDKFSMGVDLGTVRTDFQASNNNRPFEDIVSQNDFGPSRDYTPINSSYMLWHFKYAFYNDKLLRIEGKTGLGFTNTSTVDFFEANTRDDYVSSGGLFSFGGSNAPRDFRFEQSGIRLSTLVALEFTLQMNKWLGVFIENSYFAQPFKTVTLTEHYEDRGFGSNKPSSINSESFNLNNFQLNFGAKVFISTKLPK